MIETLKINGFVLDVKPSENVDAYVKGNVTVMCHYSADGKTVKYVPVILYVPKKNGAQYINDLLDPIDSISDLNGLLDKYRSKHNVQLPYIESLFF